MSSDEHNHFHPDKGYKEAKKWLQEIGEWENVNTHGFSTDGWRSIDTAPKDGTIILACGMYADRSDLGDHPRAVVWKIYHPNAPGKGAWRNHLGHKENFLTHWMPLPVAPEYNSYSKCDVE